jgi:three-Cys-motif partner protein
VPLPNFFDAEQHEASRLKIEALRKYLQPLAYKVLHHYPRLWIVDGFAGAGRYGPEAGDAPGSPVVAARFARECNIANARHGKEMALVNVEADAVTFQRLRFNLAGYGPVAQNLRGRFQDRLDDVLAIIGREPALFFIDAFGMEGADIRLVERILDARGGSTSLTELLIHFSDRTLLRVGGYLKPGHRGVVAERAGRSKLAAMDAQLGTTWWRGAFANPALADGPARCDAVAELYMQQLRKRGVRYVHGLSMRDAYDANPRYRLIFTTRSAHGSYLMSDIAASHEADLFNARYEGTFELDWQRQRRADRRDVLREEIHTWGLKRGRATPEEVVLALAPEHFGQWRTSDYSRCLRELVTLGGIDRDRAEGIRVGETLRFQATLQRSLFGATS